LPLIALCQEVIQQEPALVSIWKIIPKPFLASIGRILLLKGEGRNTGDEQISESFRKGITL